MSKDKQAVSFALMGRTFRLYFKMMRESGWGRTILYVSTSLLTGALFALNTPVMESLVTAVTNVAQGAGASVIILPAVLFFLCGAGGMALDNLGMYYQIVFEQRVRSGLMRRLMRARPALAKGECVGCGRCIGACPVDAVQAAQDEAFDILNKKISEYTLAVVKDRPHFHICLVMSVSPFCDCHPENDLPIVQDIGMFASFDPVALDMACADAVNGHPALPGSLLEGRPAGGDHFKELHPATDWRA